MRALVVGACLAIVVTITAVTQAAPPRCFSPLADVHSNNPADWTDLVTFTPPLPLVRPKEVLEILTIPNGLEPRINLDFYSIRFQQHPTLTMAAFFRQLRQQFDSFAQAENGVDRFEPYEGTSKEDDPIRARNAERWQSAEPLGAVMSFVLDSIGLGRHRDRVAFALKRGDVFLACASETDFIFSTVRTENHGYHPVSGNRGFGLKDNGDGTWTFYIKGADREVSAGGSREFGNRVARVLIAVTPGEAMVDAVFIFGERFWLKFFMKMMEYLDTRNLLVDKASFVQNSKRYPYPLPSPI